MAPTCLTLALGGGEWLASHSSCTLPPGKDRHTHWISVDAEGGSHYSMCNILHTGIVLPSHGNLNFVLLK